MPKSLTSVSKRRHPDVIAQELVQADKELRLITRMAQCLPKKVYTKRKSHKAANFVAAKTGRPRSSKHDIFAINRLMAQLRFNNLEQEWHDSQRNYTLKNAKAN